MKLERAHWSDLRDKTDRVKAKLALISSSDAWNGGARASVLLRRLKRSENYLGYRDAVTSQYHSPCPVTSDYRVRKCPECGSAHLGESAALQCCERGRGDGDTQEMEMEEA